MDKRYDFTREPEIYHQWLSAGLFTPTIDKSKTPFTIILPPPNANEPLHAGHALYVVEDILCRYHRLLGDPTLWLPGTDHAGIETQYVFEKHLASEKKSRFDYDRSTLYQLIADYVDQNRSLAKSQMQRLGFSLDWSREKFTLEPKHIARVYAVFRRMHTDNLIYRAEKIVNYCTHCGTAFSNLEVKHKTVASHLWYINYGPLSVATTRPETMLGDTAVAVNPTDPRYQKLIGTTIRLPLTDRDIPVIADDSIDIKFGTGAVKVTPAHSPEDYDLAIKHHLPFIRIFDYDGRTNSNAPSKYLGLFPNQVRDAVIQDLGELVTKIEDYSHEVGHCYRCGHTIEPITAPQWYVKIQSLADQAIKVVEDDTITIFPKRFKKSYLRWMKDIKDWPISRQIVWGPRIPVWYNLDDNPTTRLTYLNPHQELITGNWQTLAQTASFDEIKSGLQSLIAPVDAKFYLSEEEALKSGPNVLQETDTFDTWFSSGQWPYSTLGWEPDGHHSPDFDYFYPTSVLDTMWDILFFWVARMIMMGIYTTGKIPFKVAHMHSRVVDAQGKKMSKSRGNVINPIDLVDKYGADALRLALVYGVAPGSDIPLSEDKVIAQRNFVNKIWNASRFVSIIIDKFTQTNPSLNLTTLPQLTDQNDINIINNLNSLISSTTENLNKYRFGQVSENLYQFFWHDFCDTYIESTKGRGEEVVPVLAHVLLTSLKLLHPFAPFVTESVYQSLKSQLGWTDPFLSQSFWPQSNV